jgi:hypothetical protein
LLRLRKLSIRGDARSLSGAQACSGHNAVLCIVFGRSSGVTGSKGCLRA